MIRQSAAFAAVAALLFQAASALGAETLVSGPDLTTERWDGKVLSARFRAGMCFEKNGKARGVLILRHANGNEDVYHLYGTLRGDQFELSHSSGHHFSGTLEEPDKLKGSAKIKNGPRLSLSGRRTLNARVAATDCAPLD